MKLGVDVLKLPDFKIKSALYDHRDSINSAAYEVLSSWRVQYENPQEARNILLSSLAQNNMDYLLTAGEPADSVPANQEITIGSKYEIELNVIIYSLPFISFSYLPRKEIVTHRTIC